MSTSPSADDSEPVREVNKHSSRLRESCDERFSGYLLALAAQVAEQQLKEQAMAAYPNEVTHEPVDHFAVDRESEDSDEELGYGMLQQDSQNTQLKDRRESAAGWDVAEMRQHQAKLEQQRKEQQGKAEVDQRQPVAQSAFNKKHLIANMKDRKHSIGKTGVVTRNILSQNILGGQNQQRAELRQMRSAASPPMLGGDISFPKCPSPQPTMIDATQKPRSRHTSEYVEEHTSREERSGLWTPVTGSPDSSRKNSDAGLWHGVCVAEDGDHYRLSVPNRLLHTGLMTPALRTPAIEKGDPLAGIGSMHQLPTSPSSQEFHITGVQDVLIAEYDLDDEFPDSFVTQVYNYLSLGYPALARGYDSELSKISRVSVEEIRKGDRRKNAKGYVGIPEGIGAQEKDVRERCGRWRALKLYVREWGRQESRMAGQDGDSFWGDPGQIARRGSWGI
ncbi:MAG: hypothetical protein ACRYGG_06150 [Janthinobacterium lividum]